MSILNNLISSYITSALFHMAVSKITPKIITQENATVTWQTEYDDELEAITISSSVIILLLDNFLNKNISISPIIHNILASVEGLASTLLITRFFSSENFNNLGSKIISPNSFAEAKDDLYILGIITLRNFVLKEVWDNEIDVDNLNDLPGISTVDEYIVAAGF